MIGKDKIVTRKEYNRALDVVEAYHKQLFIQSFATNLTNLRKTEWTKWDKLYTECSSRLRMIILRNPGYYLEDMIEFDFLRLTNAGKKTWAEFKKLRD